MRTLLDLPDSDVEALGRIARQRSVSRASLIRDAIHDYLAKTVPSDRDAAFGLWKRRGEDGLDYQRRIRSEW
jgi:hypothetical protein